MMSRVLQNWIGIPFGKYLLNADKLSQERFSLFTLDLSRAEAFHRHPFHLGWRGKAFGAQDFRPQLVTVWASA